MQGLNLQGREFVKLRGRGNFVNLRGRGNLELCIEQTCGATCAINGSSSPAALAMAWDSKAEELCLAVAPGSSVAPGREVTVQVAKANLVTLSALGVPKVGSGIGLRVDALACVSDRVPVQVP